MLHFLVPFATLTFSIFVAAKVLDGMEVKGGLGSHLLVAAAFGVLNFLLGWLVFAALGLMTLGLGFVFAFITRWIVTAAMLSLTSKVTSRLKLRGFGTALVASLIMSVVGTATEVALRALS